MAEENKTAPGAEQEKKLPYEEWFYWLQTLVTAIVCIVLLFTFVCRVTRVVGDSMDPTLANGELLLVWHAGYSPEAGDIVICNTTTEDSFALLGGEAIVKRVVATGGQTVDIDYVESIVYVDGEPLDEPYILEEMFRPGKKSQPLMQETHFEVPEGSVFLLGDNRNGSSDSRNELLGSVDEDYLLGKAVLVFFPFSKFGLL